MQYIKINEDGTEEKVELERWVWGVVYKPTQEAYDLAKQKKQERDERIATDIAELQKQGGRDARISQLRAEMQIPIEPVKKELHQFSEDGTFHSIGEIEQEKVEMFVMYKPDMSARIDMPVFDGMRIIHKYKNSKPWYLPKFVRTYMFGYKYQPDESKPAQYHFNFILPDDRIVTSPIESIDLTRFNLTDPDADK